MHRAARHCQRRAAIAAITVISLGVIVASAALAIDMGRLYLARAELQSAADAAALAGAGALLQDRRAMGPTGMGSVIYSSRLESARYAGLNWVLGASPMVDLNAGNASSGDVLVGYIADLANQSSPMVFGDTTQYNAVRVHVRRDEERNGAIKMTFAQLLGIASRDAGASATAAFQGGVAGFHIPSSGENPQLLPLALKRTVWQTLLATGATATNDAYTYDAATGTVHDGADGIPELNLYPGSGTGQLPPGNFGTVDIGSSNNSTADISRQIRDGISAQDLAYFGGELRLGSDGTLLLNGDTGLSAAIKDDLESIKGKPRSIPLFHSVSGPGNNAYFVVTAFAGIRIMNVKLTGPMAKKCVIVQPAVVVDNGAVTDPAVTSYYVYRPVALCR
jgi:hypothetical protein